MSWLALSDGRAVHKPTAPSGALLSVGSIVIEAMPKSARETSQTLVCLDRDHGWRHKFSVALTPFGEIEVEHVQGRARFYAVIEEPRLRAEDMLRITISWNAPERVAHISAEGPTLKSFTTATFSDPMPLPADDAIALVETARIDPSTTLIAIADTVEPVSPLPSFVEGTRIETAAGPKPIETIEPGDLVPTANGRMVPVLQVVSRELPGLGQFRPVCLRAPFLGLETDLTVAPHHRIRLDGTDAEYLFGTETVLLEARHLGPVFGDLVSRLGPVVRYWQILLKDHACIFSSGTWSESLYIGTLRERPARLEKSVLADVPKQRLPIHRDIAGPLLKPYEAMVLVSNLCA